MAFLIQTHPSQYATQGPNIMTLGSDGQIWGPVGKQDLYARFTTVEAAESRLLELSPRTVAFYGLGVVPEVTRPALSGGHGWMVGHPGYDLA